MEYSVKHQAGKASRVHFSCVQCGEGLTAPLSDAGASEKCPKCGLAFKVPGTAELRNELEKAAAAKVAADKARAQLTASEAAGARAAQPVPYASALQPAAPPPTAQTAQSPQQLADRAERAPATLLLLILIAVILMPFVSRMLLPAAPVETKAIQWEYKIAAPSDFSIDLELKTLGDEGWELVTARRATSETASSARYEMIFRRPK